MTHSRHNISVIGTYFSNGVFDEKDENRGISYILDHLIYEKLAARIEDTARGYVKAVTQYGYTGFQVICPPDLAEENHHVMLQVLADKVLPSDAIEEWIKKQGHLARSRPVPADALYYAKRVPGTPLGRTLSAALCKIPSREALVDWHDRYYTPSALCTCISGCPVPTISTAQEIHWRSPQKFIRSNIDIPKNRPWKRSHVILGFGCALDTNMILAGEALCQWITPAISSTVHHRNGRLLGVYISPNYTSELQISLQCANGMESVIAKELHGLLESASFEVSEAVLERIREKVFCNYACLFEDPLSWNRLMGEAAMLYGKRLENHLYFEVFKKHITKENIRKILSSVQKDTEPCVFVTAVR